MMGQQCEAHCPPISVRFGKALRHQVDLNFVTSGLPRCEIVHLVACCSRPFESTMTASANWYQFSTSAYLFKIFDSLNGNCDAIDQGGYLLMLLLHLFLLKACFWVFACTMSPRSCEYLEFAAACLSSLEARR
eukprot:2916667-Amphidinium_carterae.1